MMLELLSKLDSEGIVALAFFALVFSVVLAKIFVRAWLRHRDRELAAAIIQDMLDQDMSSEQIERVLIAGGFDGGKLSCCAPRHTGSDTHRAPATSGAANG